MQKKVLLALFTTLTIIIFAVLMNLFSGDELSVRVEREYLSPSQKQNNQNTLSEKTWTQELAMSNSVDFQFPVNELFMQIDLKAYVPPKVKFFRLVVDRTDRYSLFCILQTLSSFNLPFVLSKQTQYPTVYVTSKTKESLDSVIKRLKEYEIESKIIEVWL
jgi:hypothetical protein